MNRNLRTERPFWKPVLNDVVKFERDADVIIANGYEAVLDDIVDKVYTRDLF